MKISLTRIIKSFFYFIKFVFIRKHFDIIFYYPIHFNRGENPENDFFTPFYEICDKNSLKYLVFEEPDFNKKYNECSYAIPFDFFLIFIIIFRKTIGLKKTDNFEDREQFIGKLLKKIFFPKLEFNNVITISNSLNGFFRGISKDIKIFDYQHGTIYSKHKGYIKNNNVPNHIIKNNICLLLYGQIFKNILTNFTNDNYYLCNSVVLGKDIKKYNLNNFHKKTILFSLQLVDDEFKYNKEKYDFIYYFFKDNKSFFIKNNVKVLLKHHPRYNNNVEFKDLLDLSFINLCEGKLGKILKEVSMHITFSSTTLFEASSYGIPTILLENNFLYTNPYFYEKEYLYPILIQNNISAMSIINKLTNEEEFYNTNSKLVLEWFSKCYENINEKVFLELIKDKNEKN